MMSILSLGLALLAQERRAEKVVVVSVDGLAPRYLEEAETPTFDRMRREGAFSMAAQATNPPITLPSHVSMLTGYAPAQHGVTWNNWLPDRTIQVPTIFDRAREAGIRAAIYAEKEKFRHFARDGLPDDARFESGVTADLVDSTIRFLTGDGATFVFLHLRGPDSAGHGSGWGSPQQLAAITLADSMVGRLLAGIEEANLRDRIVVIVSADHGGHGGRHGENIPEDMTIPWIAWGGPVREGVELSRAPLTCDTAATAMWLLEITRPDNLDGRPVEEAFE